MPQTMPILWGIVILLTALSLLITTANLLKGQLMNHNKVSYIYFNKTKQW